MVLSIHVFLYLMNTCVVETVYHYNHCLLRGCSKPLMTTYISETVAMISLVFYFLSCSGVLKSVLVLLPLLGLTWLFGLLAANPWSRTTATVFQWLFVIFNSLQVGVRVDCVY